jgi:hypothetical protein
MAMAMGVQIANRMMRKMTGHDFLVLDRGFTS